MENVKFSELMELTLFNQLKEETVNRLCEICIKRYYKKGEHIFRDKEVEKRIYVMYRGKVSMYKMNEHAQKRVIFILGKDKILNEVILDDLSASISCECFEDAQVLCFDRRGFIDIMKDDFELTTNVILEISNKTRRLYRQLKNATPIKIEKRLAAKLWKLSKDYGVKDRDGILINLNITMTYIADMFGATRETISRSMKILQENGFIKMRNKQIIVLNRKKLAEYFKS